MYGGDTFIRTGSTGSVNLLWEKSRGGGCCPNPGIPCCLLPLPAGASPTAARIQPRPRGRDLAGSPPTRGWGPRCMAWVGSGRISPIATRLLLLPRRPCRGPARLMRTQSRRRRGLPRSAATLSPSLLAPHLRSPRLSTWAPIYSAGFVFIGSRWPLPWGGGGRFSSLPWPAVRALQIDMKEKRLFLLFLLINIGIQAGGGRRRRMVSIGVLLLLYEAVPAPVPVYFPPRFLLRLQTVQRLQTFPCFPCCFLTKKKRSFGVPSTDLGHPLHGGKVGCRCALVA